MGEKSSHFTTLLPYDPTASYHIESDGPHRSHPLNAHHSSDQTRSLPPATPRRDAAAATCHGSHSPYRRSSPTTTTTTTTTRAPIASPQPAHRSFSRRTNRILPSGANASPLFHPFLRVATPHLQRRRCAPCAPPMPHSPVSTSSIVPKRRKVEERHTLI
jgi:hypothetical protein